MGEGFDNSNDTLAALQAAFAGAEADGRRVVGVYMATGSIDASLAMLRQRRLTRGPERSVRSDANGTADAKPLRDGYSTVSADTGPIRVITNDALPIVKKGLASGEIDFSICQDPVHQGTEPVRIIAEYLLSGKRPDHNYTSPILVMGASNMDEFEDHG